MTALARRQQILDIAGQEFAVRGLYGASTEVIAREAGITQAYIFRIFGTKKALFLELIESAFNRMSAGMQVAGEGLSGVDALGAMGAQYFDMLADRTSLLLQLQGFAACGDAQVQEKVRYCFGRMWDTVHAGTGLDPVTVKAFLAFGMLLNSAAAMDVEDLDSEWSAGVSTRIQPGLFDSITTMTNQ